MPSSGQTGILRLFAFAVLMISILVGIAKAQENVAKDLPECAKHCIGEGLSISGCNETDITCLCTSPAFQANTTTCITTSCSIKDILAATDYNQAACGVPPRDDSSITKKVTWTLFTTALISVIGRFVYRHPYMKGNGYGFDDWILLLAMSIMIPQQALLSVMLDQGLGRDIWTLEPNAITRILYYFWISEYFYNFVMCLEKISILLMYLRIWTAISVDAARFRLICFILLGILSTTAITMTIVVTFQCTPIDYAWHRWDGEHNGSCINTNAMIYTGAALNISYDLSVYCLPIPRLFKTQMSTRKKWGIAVIFLCSLFATVCSIIRLQSLLKFGRSANATWDYNLPALWSAVECHVTAVCACMPALAGVIKRAWGKTFGSLTRSPSGPSSGGNDTIGSRSLPRPRGQLFDEEDDGLELSRLRSTAGSIGETRTDSVHVMPKSEGGENGKAWEDGRRTPGEQQAEHVERSWLELEDGR
ncbi:hypothetical protein M409DRAFT_51594 [Zasmidium cellare ATCC 36951]|uniref:CFEM domain-containing protein n=1 Tax=Zasmidium cellare ATCC 36951 TaxID=1080233 RepID=A0A6A6CTJ2_ZASCE|nr:uncharacterized protein M409DRAFT_51594 [Zasmidium cellare ATCC 36951]KAF2170577.1 hypothetical protein M409DRAFT_51594 [Zasmidium cellare ATCC 36951]